MKTLTINHNKSNSTTYQLIAEDHDLPIAYHADTKQEIIQVLERCRQNNIRIRIFYGDVATGKDWQDIHLNKGYIGLSRGNEARFPILLYNARSMGGCSLLDHCIVKIMESKGSRVLYQAPNYHIENNNL